MTYPALSNKCFVAAGYITRVVGRFPLPANLRGGGVLRISSDGDDQMGAKIKKKISGASNKTQKNPWIKN